jgi:hypothetical protein
MPPPENITLGTLTRAVLDGAVWRDASAFPAFQAWADELERVFSFLEVQGMFERLLPRLRARESERDGALAEARTGFFFSRNGFRILRWEPEAINGHPGDLEIQWRDTEPIFVEVKGPGWEGELSPDEIRSGRQFLPKYINAEARPVGPVARVTYAISKSLPKLAVDRINLVVVVDDLFLSPTELPKDYLTGLLSRELAERRYSSVGAVFLMNPVSYSGTGQIEYCKYFVPNESASRALPQAVLEGLLAGNADPQGPWWSRD